MLIHSHLKGEVSHSAAAPVARNLFHLMTLSLLLLAAVLAGCATYSDRVAPVPLPDAQARHVDIDGVKLVARPFVDEDEAKANFGFDIRGAGLLPTRFVIDNPAQKPNI